MDSANTPLLKLPLDALHRKLGAKFAPFAGYDMPVQYEGLIAEHNWTRQNAGLFDVSHMGPCSFDLSRDVGVEGSHARVATLVEQIVPADILALKPGQIRYTTLLNKDGGVLDDLMIARAADADREGSLYIVVNAGTKEQDFDLLADAAGEVGELMRMDSCALLALQGPKAAAVMARLSPNAAALKFMHFAGDEIRGAPCLISRSGYTGEDGFEILIPPSNAQDIAEWLLDQPEVKPVGLGARDTLRLEAGLCLYGHELDPTISPIEADLSWTIQKRRKALGDFPGGARIVSELSNGPKRKRVGIRPADRAPARDGTEIQSGGKKIGVVTSGGFSPTLNAPISMGYVESAFAAPGAKIELLVRGQPRAAEIVALPFVAHNYFKG